MDPATPMNIVEHSDCHVADDSYWTPSQWTENSITSPAERSTPSCDILDVYNNAFAKLSVETGEKAKLDHFIDFINRPYFYQDVSYGTRKLKLDNGETITMPNIVRTVTRATIIAQYKEHCKEEEFSPLSERTMYRVLKVREASERKSLQGLDNIAADGPAHS